MLKKTKEERKDSFFEALDAEKYPVLKKIHKKFTKFFPCSKANGAVLKHKFYRAQRITISL